MKRVWLLLLSLCMVFCLFACDGGTDDWDDDDDEKTYDRDDDENGDDGNRDPDADDDNEDDTLSQQLPKLDRTDDIWGTTPYAEGCIFVNKSKECYCVNKEGGVLFTLLDKIPEADRISARTQFFNGQALLYVHYVDGQSFYAICDKKGNVTMPADVGATNFCVATEITLKDGYILTEKVEATYASTKSQLGVMNTDFEWVVPPSEELYTQFADSMSTLDDFVVDDCYVSAALGKSFSLKTGQIKDVDLKAVTPSSRWSIRSDGYYCKTNGGYYEEEKVKDIQLTGTIYGTKHCTSFYNGVAALIYYNEDSQKYFAAMIDENGKHLFEPVEVQYGGNCSIQTDGEYMVIQNYDDIITIDSTGKKSQIVTLSRDPLSYSISGGLIAICIKESGTYTVYFYDYDMNLLF